ncbi:uncharacterized protein K02A2.6-like [Haliotis rufescens]|uniref:uncharacterized protein K02A2.6-like n=1 Tax=Haliotis rufescens TaxID=6454 RepID=UPI00201E88F9|nr:uncharacterized protein K02A2.6-like [Haliotis rufescens]
MPYGLSSSPSAFQKILSSILQGLKGAPNMMDDIVVHGKDQIEPDQRLERVLTKLSHYNVTLNADKCKFLADEVDFLGFRVSAQGFQPTTSNVQAILDLKEPMNRTELTSFLGTTNIYLKFVPNYTDKAGLCVQATNLFASTDGQIDSISTTLMYSTHLGRIILSLICSAEEMLSAAAELHVMSVLCASLGKFVTPEELKHTSTEDTVLTQVRDFVTNGWPNETPNGLEVYAKIKDELFIFNSACVGRGERAIIPESLQQRVLYMAHNGHPGIVRMKQKCRESVWWPGIDRQIEKFVKDCEACVLSEKPMKPVAAPAQFIQWPEEPWQQLQIDIFGEVQIAPRDKRFLVVVHDMHSKWPEIAATRNSDFEDNHRRSHQPFHQMGPFRHHHI